MHWKVAIKNASESECEKEKNGDCLIKWPDVVNYHLKTRCVYVCVSNPDRQRCSTRRDNHYDNLTAHTCTFIFLFVASLSMHRAYSHRFQSRCTSQSVACIGVDVLCMEMKRYKYFDLISQHACMQVVARMSKPEQIDSVSKIFLISNGPTGQYISID